MRPAVEEINPSPTGRRIVAANIEIVLVDNWAAEHPLGPNVEAEQRGERESSRDC